MRMKCGPENTPSPSLSLDKWSGRLNCPDNSWQRIRTLLVIFFTKNLGIIFIFFETSPSLNFAENSDFGETLSNRVWSDSFQLPRVIEGGVDINDSREFELHPRAALATMGGWAAPQGKVVCSPLCPGVQPPPQY